MIAVGPVRPVKSARWWRAERAFLAASRRAVRRSRTTDADRGDAAYELARQAFDTFERIHAVILAERPASEAWPLPPYISDHDSLRR